MREIKDPNNSIFSNQANNNNNNNFILSNTNTLNKDNIANNSITLNKEREIKDSNSNKSIPGLSSRKRTPPRRAEKKVKVEGNYQIDYLTTKLQKPKEDNQSQNQSQNQVQNQTLTKNQNLSIKENYFNFYTLENNENKINRLDLENQNENEYDFIKTPPKNFDGVYENTTFI